MPTSGKSRREGIVITFRCTKGESSGFVIGGNPIFLPISESFGIHLPGNLSDRLAVVSGYENILSIQSQIELQTIEFQIVNRVVCYLHKLTKC